MQKRIDELLSTPVTIEQTLTSNSTTTVPSVAAVNGAKMVLFYSSQDDFPNGRKVDRTKLYYSYAEATLFYPDPDTTNNEFYPVNPVTYQQSLGTDTQSAMSQAAVTTAIGKFPVVQVGTNAGSSINYQGNGSGTLFIYNSTTNQEFTIWNEGNAASSVGDHYYIRQAGSGPVTVVGRVAGSTGSMPTVKAIGCGLSTTGVGSTLLVHKTGPGDTWSVTPYNTGIQTINGQRPDTSGNITVSTGSASPAFEVRHSGGTINLVPYNPATNGADLLAVLTSAQNADASILSHVQATYSLSGVTYYPVDLYGFGSTLDIPAGSDNPVTLTGNHTLRNLTIRGNDEGPYFTAQSATTLTFRNCVFKPEDGIEYMGFTTEGNVTVYFIDCDLSHCYPQTTDAVGKQYLQGTTSTVPTMLIDGTTLIDQRTATFFGSQVSNFPTKGDTAKLYVASRTNKLYRWTGSAYSELAAPSVVQITGTSATAVMSQYATTTALGLLKIGNTTGNDLATPDNSGIFLTMTSSNALEFTIYVEANMRTVLGNHYYIRQGGSGRINIVPRQVNGLSNPAPTLTCIGCDAYTTGVNSILHLIKVGPGDNWILTPLF